MNEKNYILLKDVNKKLAGRLVLRDINLELACGQIYAFTGRNGSGKTMLLRMISGLIFPDTGSVTVFGQDISGKQVFPDSLGLMIENIGLWDHLTGLENLMLLARIKNIIDENGARRALERVGLDPDDTRKYKAFSLGMKQKLAFAQAFMEQPQLLILDEPTNSMDEEAVDIFRAIIREEKMRGATILISTHQKEDVQGLVDVYYHMKDGSCTLQEEDSTDEES